MRDIIAAKRDGKTLGPEQIINFIEGVSDKTVSDPEIAALCMAIVWQGLGDDETVTLTQAMAQSGTKLDWQGLGLDGPVVDKHSSGGVGDKMTLLLAPVMAACGVYMPKMSGGPLAHTGGTVTKLSSIPGYQTHVSVKEFQTILKQVGCALVGQLPELAPADKRIYAVRDQTATVQSLPLITASILSKKLAMNADLFLADVKCGSGALLKTFEQANSLAKNLVTIGNQSGLTTKAMVTDMSQVLGHCVGNSLEVLEVIGFLTNLSPWPDEVNHPARDPRMMALLEHLGAEILCHTDIAKTKDHAVKKIHDVLDNGRAAEVFQMLVTRMGGPKDILNNPLETLGVASHVTVLRAPHAGRITGIQADRLGRFVNRMTEELAGQKSSESVQALQVGFRGCVGLGAQVQKGDPLAILQTPDAVPDMMRDALRQSFSTSADNSKQNVNYAKVMILNEIK